MQADEAGVEPWLQVDSLDSLFAGLMPRTTGSQKQTQIQTHDTGTCDKMHKATINPATETQARATGGATNATSTTNSCNEDENGNEHEHAESESDAKSQSERLRRQKWLKLCKERNRLAAARSNMKRKERNETLRRELGIVQRRAAELREIERRVRAENVRFRRLASDASINASLQLTHVVTCGVWERLIIHGNARCPDGPCGIALIGGVKTQRGRKEGRKKGELVSLGSPWRRTRRPFSFFPTGDGKCDEDTLGAVSHRIKIGSILQAVLASVSQSTLSAVCVLGDLDSCQCETQFQLKNLLN